MALIQLYKCSKPAVLLADSEDRIFKEATKLQEFYYDDSSNGHLYIFQSLLPEDIQSSLSVKGPAILLLVDNSGLSSTLPDVCTVVILFTTLSVMVMTAER